MNLTFWFEEFISMILFYLNRCFNIKTIINKNMERLLKIHKVIIEPVIRSFIKSITILAELSILYSLDFHYHSQYIHLIKIFDHYNRQFIINKWKFK